MGKPFQFWMRLIVFAVAFFFFCIAEWWIMARLRLAQTHKMTMWLQEIFGLLASFCLLTAALGGAVGYFKGRTRLGSLTGFITGIIIIIIWLNIAKKLL